MLQRNFFVQRVAPRGLSLSRQGNVELFHLVRVLGDCLDRADPGAQRIEQARLFAQAPQLPREVPSVLQLEEQTVLSGFDELGHPFEVSGDDGHSGGEGLEDHARSVLVPAGGHGQDVQLGHDAAELVAREGAAEGDPALVRGQLAQLVGEGGVPVRVPVDGERRVEMRREHIEGPHEDVAALVRGQGPDETHPQRRGRAPPFGRLREARGVDPVVRDHRLPRPYAVTEEQVLRELGVGHHAVHELKLRPYVRRSLPHGSYLAQRVRETGERGTGEPIGNLQDRTRYRGNRVPHARVRVPARYAPYAVRDLRSRAQSTVVPSQVHNGAYRPEIGGREHQRHAGLLEGRQDARREPLEVHDVYDVRLYPSHVLPRLLRHVVVLVIQSVRTRQALLRAAHPADGDALELVVLCLVGLDAAAGDAALGGEDVGFVPAGLQLPRQPKRHDLDTGAVVREELMGGEKNPHRRRG